MKIKNTKLGLVILLGLSALSCRAANRITASVSFTNAAGTTNGQTITVNGDVRTWTNNVSNPLSQVLTNSTAAGAKTNLYSAAGLAPFNGGQVVTVDVGATNLNLVGNSGLNMAVTLSAGWGSVSYSTQAVAGGTAVRIPTSMEAAAQQTNINSGLVAAIGDNSVTNALHENAPAVVNLVGLTNTQTAISGQKVFSSASGRWGGFVSNSAGISGTLGNVTNGLWQTGTLNNPTSTNGVNYGNAFSSPGTNTAAEQFGQGAIAGGANSVAFGKIALATGTSSTAIGNNSVALGNYSVALGLAADAEGANSTALGLDSIANADGSTAVGDNAQATSVNSTAVGFNAATTRTNQVMLGAAAGGQVDVPNWLLVEGGSSFGGAQTNVTYSGTNRFPAGADVSFGRYALSSLANGNNAGIVVGTNVFVQVSGPSGAFTINGIAGGRDGKWIKLMNKTGLTMTLANESGTDPTAGNRIQTGKTADVAYTNNPGVVSLIYDGNASRWVVEGSNQ